MPFIPLPDYVTNVDKRAANYSLQFNKWVSFGGSFSDPKELKENRAGEFIRLKKEYDYKKPILEAMTESFLRKTMTVLSALRDKGLSVGVLKSKVSDALVCGIGDEHPLENSLRFDHCTGLPYIPASSIKGVARYTAEYDVETDEPGRNKENGIFGGEDVIGTVQFWDGLPTKVPELKIDIMNNHFQDYYSDDSGRTAPSDDMNPIPVFFLVVNAESEFFFPVVARCDTDLQRAMGFLQQALTEWGVGAKTSVGYGMFSAFNVESIKASKPAPPSVTKRPSQIAFDALQSKASPDNFIRFLESITEEDEEWLRAHDLFGIPNFNIGFADKLLENTVVPTTIQKIMAMAFLNHIDVKAAQKRATKGDKKDLDRYERLQALVNKV